MICFLRDGIFFLVLLLLIIVELNSNCFTNAKSRSGQRGARNRDGKFLNIFQIVRFPNDPCVAAGTRNGTCYTEVECTSRNGVASGSCAAGFGVCCVFSQGCGTQSNENCTFFEATDAPAGACTFTQCRCNENICQLRLDFQNFVISGPSTSTTVVAALLNGAPTKLASTSAIPAALSTRCLVDQFTVSNPGGSTPPLICGQNTNQHMYVDASEQCNELNFQLGASSTAARSWSIKVTQVSCDSELLPPQGCTQYFLDATDTVQTYNFDGGLHLANQNQEICIRQNRGNCRICWTTEMGTDFKLSGKTTAMGVDVQEACCRYGVDGKDTRGYDCVAIFGASTPNGAHVPSRICGRNQGLVDNNGNAVTVCSTSTPFQIRFNSDNFEFTTMMREATGDPDIGFKLVYFQDNTNCFASQRR